MHAVNCEIIRLLHVPDVLRSSAIPSYTGMPGWPYRWNKPGGGTAAIASSGSRSSSTAIKTGSLTSGPEDFLRERAQDGVPILAIMGTVTMESSLLTGRLVPTLSVS
jgi:hypothetical protein